MTTKQRIALFGSDRFETISVEIDPSSIIMVKPMGSAHGSDIEQITMSTGERLEVIKESL